MKNSSLVDKNGSSLVDKSTKDSVVDLEKFKETRNMADVIYILHHKRVNLKELYNEMWLLDQETESDETDLLSP